jgi:UDP-glucose 4-epimerase
MNIVITGHRGFIGSHLIKKLNGTGIDIIEDNDILTCDLPDADLVIHLAAQPDVMKSIGDPADTCRTNIEGTVRLLKRYKDAKFIFASSGGAIQETIESPYGMSKYCAEEFIKMMHNNYVILRFANVFGPRSRSVVDYFMDGDVNIFGDGSATRTYIYVADIVDGILKAINWDNGIYMLGGTDTYTVLDLALATGKYINFLPKREGELDHSCVENNTPNWFPKVDAIKYIKDNCNV